jgi:DNA-binding IclR family transcriptional regulator
MARPALSATRAIAVLNLLAGHPTEGFTLTDVASRLGISAASTHAVLGALADAGYLVRHPRRRTYMLGPSVVALGTAALETHAAIDIARDAARRLAAETGLEVAVTTRAGSDIVFVARAGEHSPRGVPVHVGQHVPLCPPIGSVFVAWGGADEWLARSDDPDAQRVVLAAVRRRGYSVALEADTRKALGHALNDLAAQPADDGLRRSVDDLVTGLGGRDYQVRDLDLARAYEVSMIAAPVFGTEGDVFLALTLLGFGGALPGAEIAGLGERLRDLGLVATKRSRGRVPAALEEGTNPPVAGRAAARRRPIG